MHMRRIGGTASMALAMMMVLAATSAWAHDGRMTGGGSIFDEEGNRITHGFELHCDASEVPNRLEVNWHDSDGVAHRFHLLTLIWAFCDTDPSIDARPPRSSTFNTYEGFGEGRFDGVDGAHAQWKFTDAGEPGTSDRILYLFVWSGDPMPATEVLTILEPRAALTFGNHQAHKPTGNGGNGNGN